MGGFETTRGVQMVNVKCFSFIIKSALNNPLGTHPLTPELHCETPRPNAMLGGHRLSNHQHNRKTPLSAGSLGGEVGLELRGVANLSALTVASVSGPLAASAGRASGLVVLGLGAAASAVTGGTLV
jgi:hypothetical protein